MGSGHNTLSPTGITKMSNDTMKTINAHTAMTRPKIFFKKFIDAKKSGNSIP
ncbi:MAG TPA: hypothetical protein VGB71_04205 [Flavisolibacter sp.]